MATHAFPVDLPGAQAETLMWADPEEVEPAALDQLRNISALPWVHGVAAMPDVHFGKGATVGSVIAMRNAVSPAAVGCRHRLRHGGRAYGPRSRRTCQTTSAASGLPSRRPSRSASRAHDSAADVQVLGGWDAFWTGFADLHAGGAGP